MPSSQRVGLTGLLGLLAGGSWPPRSNPEPKQAVLITVPTISFKDSLAKNSIYQYYLSVVGKFDKDVPSVEVVLRAAALSNVFTKVYSNENLIFTDLKTGDTLILNSQGEIYACNNVTRHGEVLNP